MQGMSETAERRRAQRRTIWHGELAYPPETIRLVVITPSEHDHPALHCVARVRWAKSPE